MRALVEKLEFLFELPQRLARCIELEAYAQAVKYYAAATGVLKRYSHVSSFAAIQVGRTGDPPDSRPRRALTVTPCPRPGLVRRMLHTSRFRNCGSSCGPTFARATCGPHAWPSTSASSCASVTPWASCGSRSWTGTVSASACS